MKKKKWAIGVGFSVLALMLGACGEKVQRDNHSITVEQREESPNIVNPSASTEAEGREDTQQSPDIRRQEGKVICFTPEEILVTTERFFSETTMLELAAPEGAKIFYTTDGSEPNTNSTEYTEPIPLEAGSGSFPNCLLLKAKAYYADGTKSEVITHTFWAYDSMENRFETIVFSVSGEPAELTNPPDGILYEDNAKQRGRESEQEVYIEAVNPDGSLIFEQAAGVRPYGGASREASIKSMKLFARKEYDPEHGKFAIDAFDTLGADGKVMDKYDKLVLRNHGNDFQFAFIRDELNQRLAAQMGYTDCEAVVPAVVYLNGKYNGVYWLHENYCDDFLKDKYGDGEGKYMVIEGNEQWKWCDEEDLEAVGATKEYNDTYYELVGSDLTNDKNYAKLCAFMDVENYLQFYAYNIYINNNDWPQNNYKCYRYYTDKNETYRSSGPQDGRWRFLFHDMDFSTGLYGLDETQADYNNLANLFEEEDESYSPLFVKLMEREDCREYFLEEMQRIMTGPWWEKNVAQTLDNMNAEREQEMKYFFEHLEERKKTDDSIWIWYEEYLKRTDNIKKFAQKRKSYMENFLEEQFAEY